MFILTLLALVVSFLAFFALAWQTRLLRKTLEAGNYQSLIDKVLDARSQIVSNPTIGRIFEENPQIRSVLHATGMTISDFFWALQFLTTWESFYQQRRMGLLGDETWNSYKNSLRLTFATPSLRSFWLEFSQYSNYRSDWTGFVNDLCSGIDPADPILPRWSRMLRRTR